MTRRALALALGLAAACAPKAKAPARDDDPASVSVSAGDAVVRSGPIGASQPEEATYVLVDAENRSRMDRLVTLEGALVDDGGATLAPLPADELRVPAGGRRTFALVARQAFPAARRATFHVANAVAVDYPPQVAIEDFKLTPGPVPVATATARNTLDRDVEVVAAATFYDAAGKILSRPFTVVPLPVGATRQLRFEGPAAARQAIVFAGQVAFH